MICSRRSTSPSGTALCAVPAPLSGAPSRFAAILPASPDRGGAFCRRQKPEGFPYCVLLFQDTEQTALEHLAAGGDELRFDLGADAFGFALFLRFLFLLFALGLAAGLVLELLGAAALLILELLRTAARFVFELLRALFVCLRLLPALLFLFGGALFLCAHGAPCAERFG